MSTTNTTTLSDRFADSLTARMKKISEKKKPISAQTVNRAVAAALLDCMCELPTRKSDSPRAAYFSAEFLPGNLTTQGLAALGLEGLCEKILQENGLDPELLTLLPDPARGNGGLSFGFGGGLRYPSGRLRNPLPLRYFQAGNSRSGANRTPRRMAAELSL